MTDKREEIVARALCRAWEIDPDYVMANDGPRWRYYVPHARAILADLDAMEPGETFTRAQMLAEVERRVVRAMQAQEAIIAARSVEPTEVEVAERLPDAQARQRGENLDGTPRRETRQIEPSLLSQHREQYERWVNGYLASIRDRGKLVKPKPGAPAGGYGARDPEEGVYAKMEPGWLRAAGEDASRRWPMIERAVTGPVEPSKPTLNRITPPPLRIEDDVDPDEPDEPPADEEVATWSQNVGAVRAAWLPLPSIAPHAREAPGITTGHVLYLLTRAGEIIKRQQGEVARLTAERDALHRDIDRIKDGETKLVHQLQEMESAYTVAAKSQVAVNAFAQEVADRATAAEAENADLRARLEEAVTKANNFLHNAEEADAEVTQLTIERDVLRARLATFLAHADQCKTSVARGVGGMTVDANMRATRVHVSQWEIEELRTALDTIKEDRT